MTGIRKGSWQIDSVQVNSETVMENEGFQRLIVSNNQVAIEPAGIQFSVAQSTARSAVFESRSQVFFADYYMKDGQLTLNLSRPAFDEKVRLNAKLPKMQLA